MKNLTTLLLIVFIEASAFGQKADSLKNTQLQEVVITGQYEPQSAQKSVYKVRTIPSEVIQSRGAVKLQDVLNTELNIRFSQDMALGGSNLSMQGLQGQNVKVLIDGVPMVGRQGTSNEININQINVNSIDRIEIIEGPMSVVYGSDALAGVINIITKKSSDGKLDLSAKVHEETVGNEYSTSRGIHNETVGIGYTLKKFHLRGDLSRNDFGGWIGDSTGREKTWHPKTQLLTSLVTGYKGEKSNVYYRLDYTNENIFNPANFVQNEAVDQKYITNRFMHQVQGGHTFSSRLSFNGAIAYTDYQRKTQTVTVNKNTGDVRLSLGAGQQDLTVFDGLTVRSTFQYKVSDNITLQPGIDLNHESGSGGRIKEGTQSIGDYAFFLSGEWKISRVLQLRPGVRVIRNTVYDAPPAVPSINAKITLSPKHDLRVSYGRGFRAPSLRELYFNFFDASHSIEGNPNLKAEQSHSVNASWNWRVVEEEGMKFNTVVGGFYNIVDNMITNGVNPSNPLVVSYINIDKYKTQGFTWNNTLKAKAFDVSAGFSYTGRYNQLFESVNDVDEFAWSAEANATIGYRLIKAGVNLTAFYKYTGNLPFYQFDAATSTAVLTKVSPYSWADFSVQKTWANQSSVLSHISLTGGVRNLFDVTNVNNTAVSTGAHSVACAQPIGYGRSFFLSISYLLNK
ncbi:MAG: TonB-dependent receptor [Cyclobacteriaceae bacterium]|nr:TonB-dependent receptor [Cyclobacteriaceae bacterium]